jgi:hypothetical protein
MMDLQLHTGRKFLLMALVASSFLVLAGSASAARDPIAGGSIDLHMKSGFLKKLANNGITVQPVGAGSVSGKKIALEVRNGRLNPVNALGWLQTGGGFKLALGERGVPVTQLTVNTVKGAVYAKVAKARMQIGTISAPTSAREGFGANLKSVKLSLTAKAVKRISNRLGLQGSRRLNPERVLSNLYSTAQPETVTVLRQGTATLDANAGAFKKLAEKGVKTPQDITTLAPATKPNATSFQLPITGGTIAPDLSKGMVETAGGVQILKDTEGLDPTMRLSNIHLDFASKEATVEIEILPSPPFPGKAGRASLVDVVLPPNSVVVDPAARTISIKDAEARLQAVAASSLNDVFNQPAPVPPPSSNFVVGDPLGTFSMVVQAR